MKIVIYRRRQYGRGPDRRAGVKVAVPARTSTWSTAIPKHWSAWHAQYGVRTATAIDEAVQHADVVVLAVKPQQMRDVATALAPHLTRQLVLSIAAGIRSSDLSRWLGGYDAIVRTMPNTPALIGMGITGMAAQAGVSAAQREQADAVMRAVGKTVWLDDEAQIDAVTAVSGSGPAYVFYFLEAMQEAARAMGLNAEQGRELALATFTGAAQLAAQSDEPVDVLRARVTSKGGTTHAAIEQHGSGGRERRDRRGDAGSCGARQGTRGRAGSGLSVRCL